MNRFQRWWWIVLLLPLGFGLSRVHFDTDVLNLLPDDVSEVRGLKLYQQHFTDNHELLITVRGADAATAEAAAQRIAEHLRTHTQLVAGVTWQPPWQEHPEQLAELIACLWINQPPAIFAGLTNRLAPEKLEAVAADARDQLATSLSPMALGRLGYDPFGLTQLPGRDALSGFDGTGGDWFASADGTLRVVYVEAPDPSASYLAMRKWLRRIRAEVANALANSTDFDAATIRYTGSPAFVAEISSGMERDMRNSVIASLLLVAGLFWWAHRSWRPLLWLAIFLGLIVIGTLGAGGLFWGRVNAVSTGFAAILLGLAVDYALVLYQESVASPELDATQIRRLLAPSLLWSAITTAGAFGLLTIAGLPGLAQLGSMIAFGVLLAALVMLYGFLPVILRKRPARRGTGVATSQTVSPRTPTVMLAGSVALAIIALGCLLWRGWQIDHGAGSLQPKHCEAQLALDELEREMNRQGTPTLVVVGGESESAVAHRLDRLDARLAQSQAQGDIRGFTLPTALWPHTGNAHTNLAAATVLFAHADAMRAALQQVGFTPAAMALTENILNWWQAHRDANAALWPTNRSSEWILRRAAATNDQQWLAAGMVLSESGATLPPELKQIEAGDSSIWFTGWPQLADALLRHIESRLVWMTAAMIALMITCLWLAFRRWSEVLLSFAALGFSLLVLSGLVAALGWSWNLMSLMALPLLLGAGVDYTIHIQLALRRRAGDVRAVRGVTGRAVLLCAATTASGFGSNAFSSNAGMAALGSICALGIGVTYLSAAWVLPAWWTFIHRPALDRDDGGPAKLPRAPSAFYRGGIWRAGLALARLIPEAPARWLGRTVSNIYCWLHPRRRAVVEQNLLPVLQNDRVRARRMARRLYGNFGAKMVHLLRSEAGLIDEASLAHWSGWETLTAAQATGRGVLLVTPHLGDWELGGYMLARRGVRLLVLTQPEPGNGFTEMRQQSRARSGIDTIVVGQDAFAFVEVIKHLQEGAVVALLVDRPPPPTAVKIELFGRPFQASIAAAELARASGCVVLPVYVVHGDAGAEAHVLPEIAYDRQQLGQREERRRMAQRIMQTFEPALQKHADQWYHFVPVWPEAKG